MSYERGEEMYRRKMQESIKLIYNSAVNAVNGQQLIQNYLRLEESTLVVKDQPIPIRNNVYLIGFGKAVLGMAEAAEKLFLPKRIQGILSVPYGSLDILKPRFVEDSRIEVKECARNNLPDKASYQNAQLIQDFVRRCCEDDVLLILISGGGSACFSSPRSPLTLDEKLNTVKLLVQAGADIKELNRVRKRLSSVKGGQLAELAYPSTLVSLIISDIVGDPLQDIASGPTVLPGEELGASAQDIVLKYGLESKVPTNVMSILSQDTPCPSEKLFQNVHNFVIGNNKAALESARRRAQSLGYDSIVLSTAIEGLGSDVCRDYVHLVRCIVEMRSNRCNADDENSKDEEKLQDFLSKFHPIENCIPELVNTISSKRKLKLCIVCGGEITWNMNNATQIGRGGRNLHLTLLFQYELRGMFDKVPSDRKVHVTFSSAGTDGIDGVTEVAGSIAYNHERADFAEIKRYLDTFDSFNYYEKNDKMNLVIRPGHTGTNVMDIHVLLIEEE